MGLILATLETSSMVALLASLCGVLFGVIGYIYTSKDKEIREVRNEHLKDLRSKNEISNIEHQMLQSMVSDIKEIKGALNVKE